MSVESESTESKSESEESQSNSNCDEFESTGNSDSFKMEQESLQALFQKCQENYESDREYCLYNLFYGSS